MSDQSDQSAFAARDVVLCECFARDGLQHETRFIDTPTKIALIDGFAEAGLSRIEATSYSHPTHVPAFADASDVLAGTTPVEGFQYKATCPNPKAVERALRDIEAGSGATELRLLVSATEAHSMRNLRSSRAEQWDKIASMSTAARGKSRLIGVISMAFGCSFEGRVDPARVAECAARFARYGLENWGERIFPWLTRNCLPKIAGRSASCG